MLWYTTCVRMPATQPASGPSVVGSEQELRGGHPWCVALRTAVWLGWLCAYDGPAPAADPTCLPCLPLCALHVLCPAVHVQMIARLEALTKMLPC